MEILAEKRDIKGAKVKSLRAEGKIPATIFSKKISKAKGDSLMITLNLDDFVKVYAEAGESTLITVKTESNGAREVLISEVQKDPLTLNPIHVSFYEVDLTEKITAEIPIEYIGEDQNQTIKSGEGILIAVMGEIEVECLPKDLPQRFVVDITGLEGIDSVITVGEAIKVDESKVELHAEKDEVLAKIDYAEMQDVEEEEEKDVGDVEVIKEKEKEGEEGEESDEKDEEPAKKLGDDEKEE